MNGNGSRTEPRAPYGYSFPRVLAAELKAIGARRRIHRPAWKPPVHDNDPTLSSIESTRKFALEHDLVGVTFSGGGIRSGTFAVGFLQGLAHLKLLPYVDYLSTVSGGGYAGAWLAAWLQREALRTYDEHSWGEAEHPETALTPQDSEHDRQIKLQRRAFLNVQRQLSPRRGTCPC